MIFIGKVSKGTVILPPEARLPDGTEVKIQPMAESRMERKARTDALRRIAAGMEGLPTDLARNHDHYLFGTPRK